MHDARTPDHAGDPGEKGDRGSNGDRYEHAPPSYIQGLQGGLLQNKLNLVINVIIRLVVKQLHKKSTITH